MLRNFPAGVRLAAAALASLPLISLSGIAVAQDVSAVLQRAASAMGDVKSIRYAGEGVGYQFGQAFTPGTAWPKFTIHSLARTVNYETGAMRNEIVLSRAEPRGGGGYPLSGRAPFDQYVNGAHAWNVTPGGPVAGQRFIAERVHQLWTTPHGAIKAAMRNKATLRWQKDKAGKRVAVVSFTDPGRFSATLFINGDFLVERIDSRAPDAVLGETAWISHYSDYREFGKTKFPTRIRQSQNGFPVLDFAVKEVQPDAAADLPVPDAIRSATERVTTDPVAPGVWFVAGGSHNSVAIEMKDHLVLVESPLGDVRAGPVLEAVKKLAPGKPIRFVINSHHHFDHAGGLRAAVSEGATVVAHERAKAYFLRAFANPSKLSPDMLAKSRKKAAVKGVKDRLTMRDGTRTIEIYAATNSEHADTLLLVYLPKERLLIEADLYTPLPPNAPPPATPNKNNLAMVDNIERLKLSIDRILPLHGRVVPVAELYTTAGRTPK